MKQVLGDIMQKPRILVIGVGGGGMNAVRRMKEVGIPNAVDYIVIGTDYSSQRKCIKEGMPYYNLWDLNGYEDSIRKIQPEFFMNLAEQAKDKINDIIDRHLKLTLSSMVEDRTKGCIYGQAIGDALGLGAEFMTCTEVAANYPGGLERYDQIVQDRHRSRWQRGSWTDDTDMMICIALARCNNHFDLQVTAQNFIRWFNGEPLGIGRHTFNVLCMRDYLNNPIKASEITWQIGGCKSAANGGLMRTSIMGTSPVVTEIEVANICRLTHYDPRCTGSCVIAVNIIQNLIFNGRELSLGEILAIAKRYDSRIVEYVNKAASVRSLDLLSVDDASMGYTLKTLAVALWCLWHCNSFVDGLLSVVNCGGDADTNAAVACAILGAKYGFKEIPRYYTDNLVNSHILDGIYKNTIADLGKLMNNQE